MANDRLRGLISSVCHFKVIWRSSRYHLWVVQRSSRVHKGINCGSPLEVTWTSSMGHLRAIWGHLEIISKSTGVLWRLCRIDFGDHVGSFGGHVGSSGVHLGVLAYLVRWRATLGKCPGRVLWGMLPRDMCTRCEKSNILFAGHCRP